MLSFGMLCSRADWIALRRRGFPEGSPPPIFAAMLISLDNLLKILPRFASIAPLKRLTFDHLLCPAISGFPDKGYLTSKIPRARRELRTWRNYQAIFKPWPGILSIQLSGPISGPFPGSRVENLLPKPQRLRGCLNVLVDVDVFERKLNAHAQRRFQLNAFALALRTHIR